MKKIFWGTPQISVYFLEKLKKENFLFDLIITAPDKPAGRGKKMQAPAVKIWAEKNNLPILQPEKIDENLKKKISNYDFFFVFAYNKILPKWVLDLPTLPVVNLHPSLLPKYRGPSPILSALLNDDKKTGISLMILDEKMDHGPILTQQEIIFSEWEKNNLLEKRMAEAGAELFLKIWNDFIVGKIIPKEQNHSQATYCYKYSKTDAELTKPLNSYQNFLKYCAFAKPYFFDEKGVRIIVSQAEWKNGEFKILKIIPAGKKEREWNNYN